jgi:hypothetical protein
MTIFLHIISEMLGVTKYKKAVERIGGPPMG